MMNKIVPVFFVALGVVLGGTFIGSIGSIIGGEPPLKMMSELAADLKLYAIIAAIGGTFTNLRLFEGSIFQGELTLIIQQIIILLSAFLGAQIGFWLVVIFCGGK